MSEVVNVSGGVGFIDWLDGTGRIINVESLDCVFPRTVSAAAEILRRR